MGGARIVGPRAAPMSAAPGDSGPTPGTRSAHLAPPPAARRRFTGDGSHRSGVRRNRRGRGSEGRTGAGPGAHVTWEGRGPART